MQLGSTVTGKTGAKGQVIAIAPTYLIIHIEGSGTMVKIAPSAIKAVEAPPAVVPVVGRSYRVYGVAGRCDRVEDGMARLVFEDGDGPQTLGVEPWEPIQRSLFSGWFYSWELKDED